MTTVADIIIVKRSAQGRTPCCGICARRSPVTPCARCDALIESFRHRRPVTKRVPLVRKELAKPREMPIYCTRCRKRLPYGAAGKYCTTCLRWKRVQKKGLTRRAKR